MTSLLEVRCMQVSQIFVYYIECNIAIIMLVHPKLRQIMNNNYCFTLENVLYYLQGRLECEGPNNRLYDFVGNITLQSQK